MKAIYEPKGAAREYAPLALNLWRGCIHGCKFCFCPGVLHMTRDAFHEDPRPRPGILDKLWKDMEAWDHDDERTVLLSFTSDPYQPIEGEKGLTRAALIMMDGRVKNLAVLTKAGELAMRDFDIFENNPGWSFGITLTGLSTFHRQMWEPFASLPFFRIAALKHAKERGIKAWISLEPVLDFNTAWTVIWEARDLGCDLRVGKWNHDKQANTMDWAGFLWSLREYANREGMGERLYIKDALAKHGYVEPKYRVRPFG